MLPEIDPALIQPTMRRVVWWLRSLDFETTDSGDGVTNGRAGMEGTIEFPHVFCEVDPNLGVTEARRLLMECKRAGLPLETLRVEFSYNPGDEVGLVALYEITDAELPATL